MASPLSQAPLNVNGCAGRRFGGPAADGSRGALQAQL